MTLKFPRLIGLFAVVAFAAIVFHGLPILERLPWTVGYSDVAVFYLKLAAGSPYGDQPIEYPVLIIAFIRLMKTVGRTLGGYYLASSAALAAFGALTTWLLWRLTRGRDDNRRLLWHWILAPSLLIFLNYNWDIIAVFFAVLAFAAIREERDALAAAFIALAASAKFFPALYLLPLIFKQKNAKGWLAVGGTFSAAALLVNAPFAIADFGSWSYFYRMNQMRPPNPDSLWGILQYLSPAAFATPLINALSSILLITGIAASLWFLRRRGILVQCFALTVVFLLTNKVFSPQYLLWLLPFFVLLPYVSRPAVYGLEFSNLAVLWSILPVLLVAGTPIAYFWVAAGFTVIRAVFLAFFLRQAFRMRESVARTG